MSNIADKLLKLSDYYEKFAGKSLQITAKKQEKKKLDPKAKVRNRGTVVFPAESSKDKKDHFPINDEDQARNAWARANQYSSAPSWYNGSLKSLQDAVKRKVHSKYPGIDFEEKKKKSDLEVILFSFGEEVNKYAQDFGSNPQDMAQMKDMIIKIQQYLMSQKIDLPFGDDGIFGPATKKALGIWQKSVGLPVTNNFDEATLNKLSEVIPELKQAIQPKIDATPISKDTELSELVSRINNSLPAFMSAYQSGEMIKNREQWIATISPMYKLIIQWAKQLPDAINNPQLDTNQKSLYQKLLPQVNTITTILGQYYTLLAYDQKWES